MNESSESPKDAFHRQMWRLNRAARKRRNNPYVHEWEEIDDRNNFGPGIEKSMQGRSA